MGEVTDGVITIIFSRTEGPKIVLVSSSLLLITPQHEPAETEQHGSFWKIAS